MELDVESFITAFIAGNLGWQYRRKYSLRIVEYQKL
jgi:hypothetical protein